MIAFDYVDSILRYDSLTGDLTWKVAKAARVRPGDKAGSLNPIGYVNVFIDNVSYKAHRLAWLLHHKAWPEKHIDHINGIRNDNRIANLRDVPQYVNARNRVDNKTGVPGVFLEKRSGN